jgi:hypothetical protein
LSARFKRWLERHHARSAAWERAWSDAGVYGTDGRTNFQRSVLAAVEPLVGALTLSDDAGDAGRYLTGRLPGTDLTLYLYVDEVQAHGKSRRFVREKWDYDTPEALVDDFLVFIRDSLQSNNRWSGP